MLRRHLCLMIFLSPALLVSASGCHCMGISERYGNVIDCVADRQLCMDGCYRPGLDLTRLCRPCIHEQAMVRNIGVYPHSTIPTSQPVETTMPPVEIENELPLKEDAPPPPAPIPPVPAAELPVIDIDSLKEISQWKPEVQSANDVPEIQLSSAATKQFVESLVPVESIAVAPVRSAEPVSAPASIPPSQRFYTAKQAK